MTVVATLKSCNESEPKRDGNRVDALKIKFAKEEEE